MTMGEEIKGSKAGVLTTGAHHDPIAINCQYNVPGSLKGSAPPSQLPAFPTSHNRTVAPLDRPLAPEFYIRQTPANHSCAKTTEAEEDGLVVTPSSVVPWATVRPFRDTSCCPNGTALG
jgi:hypothetical protein